MPKTYFIVDQFNNNFPTNFVTAKGKKHISVRYCRCVFKDYIVADIELHASFVRRDDYFNGFVCFANTLLTKYRKYEYESSKPEFRIWFTNMDGEAVDVQKFKLEMTLEF